ncbi:hypothetical protein [Paenibacillus aquistagni]|nr:hypothetical protein [Paenibacillus aquistagni]
MVENALKLALEALSRELKGKPISPARVQALAEAIKALKEINFLSLH